MHIMKVGWSVGKKKLFQLQMSTKSCMAHLEVTQRVRSSWSIKLAQRTASSKAQNVLKESNHVEEEGVKPDMTTVHQSILNQGLSLHHKHSSTLIHLNENLLDVNGLQLQDTVIDNPKWLTPEKLKHIQNELKRDRKAESPASNIESLVDWTWHEQKIDYSKLLHHYLMLSKIRLTGLVVLTQMAGFAIAPGVFDLWTFMFATVGTSLTSASANATNQFLEVPYDSQMNRTKNRVIVRGFLTPAHALSFASVCGSLGVVTLFFGANPLTAGLGAFNWILYTVVYTPMKRMSITNTWFGSIVGAIPPMMGWAAATGALEPGAWLLGAILFAWQFPHFNALSWNLRPDYSRGGYRMMSVINPDLCKRVAMRYSFGMIGLCLLAPVLDITTWTFAFDSLPLNGYFAYLGWRFYSDGDSNSSRKLFRFSLIHIPVLLILMLISKKHKDESEPSSDIKHLTTKLTEYIKTISKYTNNL